MAKCMWRTNSAQCACLRRRHIVFSRLTTREYIPRASEIRERGSASNFLIISSTQRLIDQASGAMLSAMLHHVFKPDLFFELIFLLINSSDSTSPV